MFDLAGPREPSSKERNSQRAPLGQLVGAVDVSWGVCRGQAAGGTDGARAGETLCTFESKRQTKLGWDVVARCSNSHERWTANVSLNVKDNRLSWKSQRGTQTYLRCQREEMMAQAQ